MENLIILIGAFIEILIMIVAGSILIGVKIFDFKKGLFLIAILGTFIFFILSMSSIGQLTIKFLLFLALIFIIKQTLRLKLLFALLIVSIGFFLIVLAEFISYSIIHQFININEFLANTGYVKLLLIFPHVILILIGTFICYKKNWLLFSIENLHRTETYSELNKKIATLSLIIFFIANIVFAISYKSFVIGNDLYLFVSIMIVSLFLLLKIKNHISTIIKNAECDADEHYQNAIESHFNFIKTQHHDFLHHVNTIYGLLQTEQYDSCTKYISELNKEVAAINEVIPLHSVACSSLLQVLKQKATLLGIELKVIVKHNFEQILFNVTELNRIIGNLIENAFDEVRSSPPNDKWVEIIFDYRNEYFYLIVSNHGSINQEYIDNIFNVNFTSKNGENCGLGLPSVKKIVEKYNGLIYLESNDNETSFIVQIPCKP